MHGIASWDGTPEVFHAAAWVVFDEPVCCGEDGIRAAVVLLQADDLGIREVFFKLQDVRHLGPAPPVDALVVIAHHADIGRVAGREQAHQIELQAVGVLEFIDHHLAVAGAPFVPDILVFVEKAHGLHEQVVEIHRIQRMKLAVVAGIDRADHGFVVLWRGPAVVFGFADEVFCQAGIEFFILGRDAVDDFFDQPELVALVKDGEVVFVADFLGIASENPDAEGVEGGCGDLVRFVFAQHPGDALLHFAGRFVGEGDGQNFRRGSAGRDEPGDAGNDGSGFSSPRSGKDEQRAVLVRGGALLLGIQVVESEAAHGSSLRANRTRTSG